MRILLFTQPGCLSCELMRVYLEANQLTFEEHDICSDAESRRILLEQHGSHETPTLVFISESHSEVIVGFDPVRMDQLLTPAPSSDSVTES